MFHPRFVRLSWFTSLILFSWVTRVVWVFYTLRIRRTLETSGTWKQVERSPKGFFMLVHLGCKNSPFPTLPLFPRDRDRRERLEPRIFPPSFSYSCLIQEAEPSIRPGFMNGLSRLTQFTSYHPILCFSRWPFLHLRISIIYL